MKAEEPDDDLLNVEDGEIAMPDPEEALAYYASLGVQTLRTSVISRVGLDALSEKLRGRITVLAGHSGVGKSSLITAVQPSLVIRVGDVSIVTEKGRHTTTSARYYPLENDATGAVVAFGETTTTNHCFVNGLEPDTVYTYRVTVAGEEWAAGPRRDWSFLEGRKGMVETGRVYDNRFRTNPHPEKPAPLTFAAIGDFGTGIRHPSTPDRQQREVAGALEKSVDEHDVRLILTTGDNIYAGRTLLGIPVGATGDEDSGGRGTRGGNAQDQARRRDDTVVRAHDGRAQPTDAR